MEKIGSKLINNTVMQDRIFTEDEYRKAIIRFLEICDSDPDSPEYEEAQKLTRQMEEYENMSCFERYQLN